MRKADYILQRCNQYDNLTSNAQAWEPSLEPRPSAFKGPEIKAPSVRPRAPVAAPKPIVPDLDLPKGRVAPTPTVEPGKPSTPTGESKLKMVNTPQGMKLRGPAEWHNADGSIKPEFEKEFNAEKRNLSSWKASLKAAEEHRTSRKLARSVFWEEFKANKMLSVAKLAHPDWASLLTPKALVRAFAVIGLVTAICYLKSGKKPTSSDPTKQQAIDSAYGAAQKDAQAVSLPGPELKTKINELVGKLSIIKPKSPKGQELVRNNIELLNNYSKQIETVSNPPSVDDAKAMQSFINKSNTLALEGLDTADKLDRFVEVLNKSQKQDLAKLTQQVSDAIKDHSSLHESMRDGVDKQEQI